MSAKSTHSCSIGTEFDYLHPHGDTQLHLTIRQGDFNFCITRHAHIHAQVYMKAKYPYMLKKE